MSKLAGMTGAQAVAGGAALIGAAFIGLYATGLWSPNAPPSSSAGAPDTAEQTALAAPTAEVPAEVPAEIPAQVPAQVPDETSAETSPETSYETSQTPQAPEPDPPSLTAAPAPPRVDIFRLEPDGRALIAGSAAPGWSAAILIDGAEVAQASTDAAGQFVQFLTLETSAAPRVLTLTMRAPQGEAEIASQGQIIIAPTPAPDAGTSQTVLLSEPEGISVLQAPVAAPDTAQPPEPQDEAAPSDAPQPQAAQIQTTQSETPQPETSQSDTPQPQTTEPDTARSQTTQPPQVMSTVALDTITYSDIGEVQLSGRGAGEGFVRVYLDNRPIITSRISETGAWRTDLPQVDTGVYTLRIDEVAADGSVTSRVETPFQREDETVLAAAQAAQATQTAPDTTAQQTVRAITVQPGSTLWAISREAYGEGLAFVRVFEANRDRIRDPDLIYPGQVFTLPD